MTNCDYAEFEGILERAALVTFTQKNKDWGALVNAMFEELSAYSLEEVRAAASAHCRAEKFFPALADIVRHVDGSKEDLSVLGWRMFLKAWERYGIYTSVRFPHPAYHYAVEQYGGWVKLLTEWRDLQEEELHFRAKEWQRLYGVGLKCASWRPGHGKVKVLSHLAGLHEIQNCAGGYLQHLPDVIAVDTGEAVGRGALAAGEQAAATGLLEGFKMPQLSVIGGD